MYCKNCGSQIDDNAVACPYCGAPVERRAVAVAKRNGWGIAGFVLALISIFASSFYGIVSVLALIFSIVGVAKRKKRTSCNGLAVAGLVISIITLVGWVIVLAAIGGFFAIFG